jgi:hypothetical protein
MGRGRGPLEAQGQNGLTEKGNIQVHVKYKDIDETFNATSAEQAWLLLNKFFHEFIPSFEIANKLWLEVDTAALAKDLEGIVTFSLEGSNLMPPKSKLTDNETLTLWLAASYVGQKLGKLQTDSLTKEELQTKLGKSGKITSTRLGELIKGNTIAKTDEDRYRITTFGVAQLQKDILPKIRAKTNM